MTDVTRAPHQPSHLGTGLLVAGIAGAASLQPSVSHRSLTQQAIITGVSMGAGFLAGSLGATAADSITGSIPGGSAGAYAALGGGGAALMAAARLGAPTVLPGVRGAASSLGLAMAVTGAAGLSLSGLSHVDDALAPHLGAAGTNPLGAHAASITASAAAVAGAALFFHQPAHFVGEASRVTAQAARAFEAAPEGIKKAAVGAEGATHVPIPELSATVSGGANSLFTAESLGKQGRYFASERVAGEQIRAVMGSGVDPIRAYAGLASAPTVEGRVDKLMAEAEHLGVFDGSRKRILIATSTGSGFIDPPSVQAAEYMSRGEMATLGIQYNNEPSVVTQLKGRTKRGAEATRLLLAKVNERIAQLPEAQRPEVTMFGESLGALAQHQSFGASSVAEASAAGVDRALWVGVPQESKFQSRAVAALGSEANPGTLRAFDRIEGVEQLSAADRASLKHVVLAHDNDAVHTLNKRRIWFQRPEWLPTNGTRPAGVPTNERYIPVVTGVQSIVDLLNGTHPTPGKFEAYSHDYRADLPEFVRVAFDHATPGTAQYVSPEQVQAITNDLVKRELERAALGVQAKAARAH